MTYEIDLRFMEVVKFFFEICFKLEKEMICLKIFILYVIVMWLYSFFCIRF